MKNPQQTSFSMVKTESISTKIKTEIRMSTFSTVIQHSVGIPSHGNQKRKQNKSNPKQEKKS